MQAFKEFKTIWDPQWKMNPGKILETYGQTNNLRTGTTYNPPVLKTHFQFPEQHNNFAEATNLCVGVGKCRRHEEGTMCPSYMVTREEEDSTRGRARMLFEMMTGDVLKGGWRNEEVKESLDLCLACKGCKNECPVNVDMATYKAEFLSHYYEGKLRPVAAYSMGWIYWWAQIASLAPGLANAIMSLPIARRLGGVAPERKRRVSLVKPSWNNSNVVQKPRRRPTRGACCCGRTHSTITSIPALRMRRRRCWRLPGLK